ncbi:MAG: SDR family oxidoreductase [Desulfovibrionaceae bacterium]|nr:SDR family oxidoreductase [Desulfovibrionaceae bacterium]
MDTPMTQQIILVTGASSGIGRAVCRELAGQGASIVLLARSEAGMRETMSAMPAERCLPLRADLRDLAGLPAVVDQAWNWRGRIDGCVYCAGVAGRARLRDTSPEFMAERMQVNCLAFVELMRLLVKHKKKAQPLRVVTLSSLAALGRDRYLSAYAASKAAMEAAAKTLAVELLPRAVTINIIRPAFVNTPMIASVTDPMGEGDFVERLEESGYQPMGVIEPEEVAHMAAYLMGPGAAHISGATFSINAGAAC